MKQGMNKDSTSIFCTIVILIVINSCTWNKTPFRSPEGGVCYQTQIEPIINSNCAMSGCHDGTGEAGSLTSYNDVMQYVKPGKPDKSKLVQVITGKGEEFMPPASNSALTQDQINLIQQWILEGAGNDPNCAFSLPCDSTNVTYSGTVFPIIQNNCLGCHSSGGSGATILLSNYAQIKDKIDRVWGAINYNNGFQPMPQDAAKLSDCDIALIGIWINAGAQDN